MPIYLSVSPSPDAWRNLAADEWFLDHLTPDDTLLYFYQNARAVIIGRSQNPWAECRLDRMARDGVQLARRISGGGAVYHDAGNLNFSFITGEAAYDVPRQLGVILRAVRGLGIPCEISGRNDLLADGRKFSGNAFCARGGMRQHHGTLLVNADMTRLSDYLNPDPRKLASKGVKSVRARVCNLTEFVPSLTCDALRKRVQDAFAEEYGAYTELQPADADIAPYYEKQQSGDWRLGHSPRFDYEIDERFPWGGVRILLTLRRGAADEVTVYTDANDARLADTIAARLRGIPFGAKPLSDALRGGGAELDALAEHISRLEI